MFGYEHIDTLLSRADVIVIAAPLTSETTKMIAAPQFARMKRGAVLNNVGRARIIDHEALDAALRSGHLGGASLDVFHREPLPAADPLWTAPNVILTPHTSGFRHGHWNEVIDLFADNLQRFRRGEPVRSASNRHWVLAAEAAFARGPLRGWPSRLRARRRLDVNHGV